MCGLLTLLHTSGELVMLRQMYRPPTVTADTAGSQSDRAELRSDKADHMGGDVSCGLVDLSCLYDSWPRQRWTELHQLISHARRRPLQLCWVYTRCIVCITTFTL